MKTKGIKTLVASLVAIVISFAMLVGTTFAWFTDSTSSNNNIIASGNLDVNAYWMEGNQDPTDDSNWVKFDGSPIFNYSNWEPGRVEAKHVKITNEGTLAFKYKLNIVPNGPVSKLADVIDVYFLNQAQSITRNSITSGTKVGTLADLIADPDGAAYGILLPKNTEPNNPEVEIVESVVVSIAFKMQENTGNEYFGLSIGSTFDIVISATQYAFEEDTFGNDFDADAEYAPIPDSWNGTVSLSWFNPNNNEQVIDSAEAFAGFVQLIDGISTEQAIALGFTSQTQVVDDQGNIPATWNTTMEGQTIKLESDLDLLIKDENGEIVCFEPIGSYRFDKSFMGVFDGQGHTIKNLTQNTWALNNGYYYNDCGLGLFGAIEGELDDNGQPTAGVKNLIIDGANISGESALCGTVAAVAQNAFFENITIKNANVADYQYYAGGVVGWASGVVNVVDCNIDASTNIAAQWGDFDNSIGGVIGGASGSAEILLKDCMVACRIDAYNDVTSSYQWFAYRRAGMLIGNSGATQDINGETFAAAPQLTCENVTVIYGDWANYTYCEFAGTSWPYVRVQEGVSNGAYSNPRYGHPSDANGNEVVDDNHVHNDGEDHFIKCTFDQLYGGGQGVYGMKTHDGVTIIYNNK